MFRVWYKAGGDKHFIWIAARSEKEARKVFKEQGYSRIVQVEGPGIKTWSQKIRSLLGMEG